MDKDIKDKAHTAILRKEKEKILPLINQLKDINNMDFGETLVHVVVDESDLDTLQLLIERKADLNLKNEEGYTAMYLALVNQDLDILKLLIESGGDFNILDPDGNTLLANAVSYNSKTKNEEIIKYLLSLGIDPKHKNKHGNALDVFLEMPKNEKIKYLFE